jgi:hypothetical protein
MAVNLDPGGYAFRTAQHLLLRIYYGAGRNDKFSGFFHRDAGSSSRRWGIFSNHGPGPYPYHQIRGATIIIYGKGVYRHMDRR